MADITKANEQIAAWDDNLEKLKNGVFGAETSPEALVRYWQAQAEAGYPGANDNFLYFLELKCSGARGVTLRYIHRKRYSSCFRRYQIAVSN